jgi:RHS repeat-associated protein
MGAYARAQNVLTDDADHLPLLSNKQSDNDVISSFAYSVDKTGNRTKLTLSNGDYAEYLYDQTYQLTREHRKDSQNATLYYNNFRYDPAGNRTRLEYNDGTSTTTTSYLYNTADQLTREVTGETITSYWFDANGNLTKKDDGTNVHAYKYDARNLMTDYDGPGSNNDAAYKYGASGLRVQKTVGGSTTTKYYQDGLNTLAEYNGSNQLQRTYVTPGLDQNLSLTASGSTYYYLTDALGSIRQVLDADQATQNSYEYQAFGSAYGSPTENVTQPFRFTGREWDGETGLYHYRARSYGPRLGRFVARDPELDNSGPLYVYARNAPAFYIDPLGEDGVPQETCERWVGNAENGTAPVRGKEMQSLYEYSHTRSRDNELCLKNIECRGDPKPLGAAKFDDTARIIFVYRCALFSETGLDEHLLHELQHAKDYCDKGKWQGKAGYMIGEKRANRRMKPQWSDRDNRDRAVKSARIWWPELGLDRYGNETDEYLEGSFPVDYSDIDDDVLSFNPEMSISRSPYTESQRALRRAQQGR